jgi:hypothetical protein
MGHIQAIFVTVPGAALLYQPTDFILLTRVNGKC